MTIGPLAYIVAILLATTSLMSGNWLGSPEPEQRLTIALANATWNAGLALAIATFALLSAVAGGIYSNLYQKKLAQPETAT